ncbi:MAG: hypothetical protein ACI4TU_09990 [Candidatus Cryptobacteroides sp.]
MTRFAIFNSENWFLSNYDGRRKEFRGISSQEFNKAKSRHNSRHAFSSKEHDFVAKAAWRREVIAFFASIPFEFEGDGFDDYSRFQRPSSNGVGYVSVCPGERGNNYYVDDPILVKYLTTKFHKHNNK